MSIDRLWYTRCPLPTASGITSVAGLKGKRLALPVEAPYIGNVAASSNGPLFDARQAAVSTRAEAFALIRGQVDAIYNYGAAGPSLQTFLGAAVVADINHHPDQTVAINKAAHRLTQHPLFKACA